ncbi:MAG: hypothetical protein A3G11_00920 [Candidatus Lloydbacteria bacterium RIFCSPLOWO2_12_FULL_51_9]|uniref:Ornithine aminotransferase n=2 Tax=Candidatus Lloydiibacteriota TaxID=1817910 RepID=A0A1G2DS70_9BACT|nr:MAG: hypothetical protein A3J08_03335 [Candidatus Lloydbacteria bacterium RIFCSPLOWO2_02_FULL_51_11]OGZ16437.1 MAG: hypothetical protein A3G11_00920 [Candidatus Lloydbacteria bacterium RIFCSPLOWO2_12_FULL_51_9]
MPQVQISGDLSSNTFTVNGTAFLKQSVADRQAQLAKIAPPNYKPMEGWIATGRGSTPWTLEFKEALSGKTRQVIDCQTMYSTANAGHGNAGILDPFSDYQRYVWAPTGNGLSNDLQLPALMALRALVGLNVRIMTKSSGGEVVDTALKIARKFWWLRHERPSERSGASGPFIVVAQHAFHGRTLGATSLFHPDSKSRQGFGPFPNSTLWVPFNDTDAMKRKFEEKGSSIAGVLLEPIQGEAGIFLPDDSYLKHVEYLCRRHGALFMLDEIQTGFGRTGKNFAFEHYGVKPDILLLGKALGGGVMPVSAILARTDVSFGVDTRVFDLFEATIGVGEEGQTWSGSALSCFAILAAIRNLCDKNLAGLALEHGGHFVSELLELQKKWPKVITEVRGKGLMVGVDFTIHGREVSHALLREGVWACATGETGHTVRFLPPLMTPTEVLSDVVVRLGKALTGLSKST